jgi:hypothetical protein
MKSAKASNLSEYKKLSKSERECYGLYRTPEFYEMNGDSFEDYWKSNYPIQFTIRNSAENFWITLSVWKDKIIDNTWRRLFPRNKWARKSIPHTYSDKVELVKDFLFASIVDFVENEPIEFTDWESSETHKNAFRRINKCYAFIKKEMSEKQNTIDELMDDLYGGRELDDFFSEKEEDKMFDEINKLSKELEEEIQFYCIEIVSLRNFLWT